MTDNKLNFIFLVIALLFPLGLSAHHSAVGFDLDNGVELEGELVRIIWRNPHVGFVVNIADEKGVAEEWKVSGHGSLYTLKRTGISRDHFRVGDQVKLYGYASTIQRNSFLATNILLPDGTEAVMKADKQPHWAANTIGGSDEWVVDEQERPDTVAENLGIFRVWSPSGYGGVLNTSKFSMPFTDSAIAARDSWDPFDNPVTRCELMGLTMVMIAPHPFRFEDRGTRILLHAQMGDWARTIFLEPTDPDLKSPEPSLGLSIGRWDGRKLIVETTNIDYPYFDRFGTPQSQEMRIHEEFTLSEDQSRLDYHLTMADPSTFSEPATVEAHWLALGEDFDTYECEVF